MVFKNNEEYLFYRSSPSLPFETELVLKKIAKRLDLEIKESIKRLNIISPVMRHLRDFEIKKPNKYKYCIFIAPRLHQDTVETFWMAVKYGYRGQNQKIVPLSLNQFIGMLETLLEIKKQGKTLNHVDLLKLYDDIIELTSIVEHSGQWIERITESLKKWKNMLLS